VNAPVSASQMRGRPIVKERRSFIDCTRQSSKSKLEDLVPRDLGLAGRAPFGRGRGRWRPAVWVLLDLGFGLGFVYSWARPIFAWEMNVNGRAS